MRANKFDMSDAWMDVLVHLFDKPIYHDCTIPDPEDMHKILREALEATRLPDVIRLRISALIGPSYRRSPLASYITGCEARFGWEMFGDRIYFRWRDGEKKRSKARVRRYLSIRQRKAVIEMKRFVEKRIWDMIVTITTSLSNGINEKEHLEKGLPGSLR